jgi:subtilisin-like proprotein convertase family protein
MTLASRRWGRRLAPLTALTLTGALVVLVPAVAIAAQTTTFSQTDDIFVGGPDYEPANPGTITIADATVASPYPSTLTATHAAPITDVDVGLHLFSHLFPDDVDVLLVGPGGQQVTLMSDVGGPNPAGPIDLTFSDEAAAGLPDGTALSGGTFKPTNVGAGDSFPAPAPVNADNTSLSVFDGTSPVGTWSLYVVDDSLGAAGQITGGWQLSIDQQTTPYPSTISVSGLPAVTDVNVTLKGITSSFPRDVDVLLVGPGGRQATVMSSAGGGNLISDVDITLDDEAAAPLPDASVLTTGSYRPGNYGSQVDSFPAPAPVSTGNSALWVFDGLSPNGQWHLYAVDTVSMDVTSLSGWSLDISWTDTVSPTGTLAINGAAGTTTKASVTLNVSANDPAPSSGVKEMRFSNDGVTYGAFMPYAASAGWTLTKGDGLKTVYAQFRDGDGNVSTPASDTITLDTAGPRSVKTKPKNKAEGVAVTTKIKIKANEALAKKSVNKRTVVLTLKGGDKVEAKVSYDSAKHQIALTPKANLRPGRTYQVKIKAGVKDLASHGWDESTSRAGSQALTTSFQT